MKELENQIKNRLTERMKTDVNGLVAARNTSEYTQKAVMEILTEIVGQDNVRAYGIHFRGEDFFLYGANSEDS